MKLVSRRWLAKKRGRHGASIICGFYDGKACHERRARHPELQPMAGPPTRLPAPAAYRARGPLPPTTSRRATTGDAGCRAAPRQRLDDEQQAVAKTRTPMANSKATPARRRRRDHPMARPHRSRIARFVPRFPAGSGQPPAHFPISAGCENITSLCESPGDFFHGRKSIQIKHHDA